MFRPIQGNVCGHRTGVAELQCSGRLSSINTQTISRLRQQWHLFLIPKREVCGRFYHTMNAFMCPLGHSALPRNLHLPAHDEEDSSIIWLARDIRKATAVAEVLQAARFPDFGLCLDALAQATRTNLGTDELGCVP